jgi:hypothetical protein
MPYAFPAHLHDEIHLHLGAANRRKAVSHVVTDWPHTHVPSPQELPWEGIIKSRKSIN